MTEGLPNVTGNERSTLYIIGNGFDLSHGILSKYKHFCCWLNLNGYEDYATTLQTIFPKLDGRIEYLWSNFESALETYDLHKMYEQYVPLPENTWNDEEWERSILSGTDKISHIANELPALLKKWAKNIRIGAEPRYELSPESKFLTFNYTNTLEKLYHIPHGNICHIHESIDGETKLIVGHDFQRATNDLPAKSDEEEKAQAAFVEIMNGMAKPKRQQIEKNRVFFSSLRDITTVIEIGHSMAPVDLIYFEEVRKSVAKDALWYFSVFSEKDKTKMKLFVQPALLAPKRVKYDTFNIK
jgi:hypothetical protein